MDDPSRPAAVVAEAEVSGAPQRGTVRLVLDLGIVTDEATDQAAALVRDLARGVWTQIEAMLTDPATDLPPHLRDAFGGLAGALAEQTDDRATVTALDTPLARAWRAHPAQGEP